MPTTKQQWTYTIQKEVILIYDAFSNQKIATIHKKDFANDKEAEAVALLLTAAPFLRDKLFNISNISINLTNKAK